jgi:hypothetical protein
MRTRVLLLAAVFAVVVAWPLATPAAPVACAATAGPRAALVVDTGARVVRYCVALDAPSVSGLHLIELASDQHDLSYAFGLGGLAVCRLAGVGPAGDDCFADYPDYWGYWHGDGRGGWSWAPTGAGEASIGNGDVDGWSWGSGDAAASHPAPPPGSFATLCPTASPAVAPAPKTTSAPTPPSTTPAQAPTRTASDLATTTRTSSPGHASSPRHATSTPRPLATPTDAPSAGAVRAAATIPPAGGGSLSLGVVLALALVLVLGVGGWLRVRRRDAP